MMKTIYPKAFIEQAIIKVLTRSDRTVASVADELNMNYHTLKNWMKRGSMTKSNGLAEKGKPPQNWSAEEQLLALQESHSLSGEVLAAWCREHGLFDHNLTAWKTTFCAESKAG
jgi:transposase-like protein